MEVFLETERLVLRRFTEEDADNLFELDSDPEVVRFANPGGRTTPYEDIRRRVLPRFLSYYDKYDHFGFWAAVEKSSGRFVGWFHLRPVPDEPEEIELGYRLRRDAWGKGYATEGSRALVKRGFVELGLKRVVAKALVANEASIRVMEKAGLKFESKSTYPMYPDRDMEMVEYALERDGFRPDEYAAT